MNSLETSYSLCPIDILQNKNTCRIQNATQSIYKKKLGNPASPSCKQTILFNVALTRDTAFKTLLFIEAWEDLQHHRVYAFIYSVHENSYLCKSNDFQNIKNLVHLPIQYCNFPVSHSLYELLQKIKCMFFLQERCFSDLEK